MEITLKAISSTIYSQSLCPKCGNGESCDISKGLTGITHRKGWSYPTLDVIKCGWFITKSEAKIIDEEK